MHACAHAHAHRGMRSHRRIPNERRFDRFGVANLMATTLQGACACKLKHGRSKSHRSVIIHSRRRRNRGFHGRCITPLAKEAEGHQDPEKWSSRHGAHSEHERDRHTKSTSTARSRLVDEQREARTPQRTKKTSTHTTDTQRDKATHRRTSNDMEGPLKNGHKTPRTQPRTSTLTGTTTSPQYKTWDEFPTWFRHTRTTVDIRQPDRPCFRGSVRQQTLGG
mmetsp:Transcript_30869/g.59512  ORF Transcript_30869/g.59512 Transcript_30869/m.59512 type:complete len:221 (-) Transcript_30869:24-686(-)